MVNDSQSPRHNGRSARDEDLTYTILVRDFSSTVTFAGARQHQPALISLELQVIHPGRQFPDDIAAVMSYEDIVLALRSLCQNTDIAGPQDLAERTLELCMIHKHILKARVDVVLPEMIDSTGPLTLIHDRQPPN